MFQLLYPSRVLRRSYEIIRYEYYIQETSTMDHSLSTLTYKPRKVLE